MTKPRLIWIKKYQAWMIARINIGLGTHYGRVTQATNFCVKLNHLNKGKR